MAEQRTLDETLADLQQSQQVFLAILEQVDDAALYRRPIEQEWSVAENLVHISEARQFFAAEASKALTTPGARIGRTITDPDRIQTVFEHGHDPRASILQNLMASFEQVMQTLKLLRADDLDQEVQHVKYGPQTLAAFLQHFIIEHDQTHASQVTALL